MEPETFKKSLLRGWITSSRGFRIRLLSRAGLVYEDKAGSLRVDSESMAGEGITVVLYTSSIPDTETRSRQGVLDNIARAFNFAGWTLMVQE